MTNEPLTHHIGLDGFVWWIGVIESITDPLKVGRAKVRIIGWHTEDKNTLSTDELPWALPVAPVTASTNVANYKEGDWVLGFFLDASLGQQPMVFGVFPSIPQKTSSTSATALAQKLFVTGLTGI